MQFFSVQMLFSDSASPWCKSHSFVMATGFPVPVHDETEGTVQHRVSGI